jgi:hypothetical protein
VRNLKKEMQNKPTPKGIQFVLFLHKHATTICFGIIGLTIALMFLLNISADKLTSGIVGGIGFFIAFLFRILVQCEIEAKHKEKKHRK